VADDAGRAAPESDSPLRGRIGENATRVAAMRAWWRHQFCPTVTVEDAEWGLDVVRYVTASLEQRAAIKIHVGSPFAVACEAVLTMASETPAGIKIEAILRRLRQPLRTVQEVLSALMASGDLVAADGPDQKWVLGHPAGR